MPTAAPKSGVTVASTTTGTGAYLVSGAVSPWSDLVSADDGKLYPFGVYQAGVGYEILIGTYTHSTRQIARTQVLRNHLLTTDPVDWGAGTKEISIIIPGERAMLADAENKLLASQYLRGFPLYLDADDDSYLDMQTDDVLKLLLASVLTLQVSGGLGNLSLISSDSSATEGPEIALVRRSGSPAINDALAVLRFKFLDLAGAEVTAFKMRAVALAVTGGAHSTQVTFEVAKNGSNQTLVALRPDAVSLQAGISFFTGGKTTTNLNAVGAELYPTGELAVVAQDVAALFCYRKGSDGDLQIYGRDGSAVGTVSVAAGVVTYGTFTGGHWSEWAGGEALPADEVLGTVVATAHGLLDHGSEQLPLVQLAQAGDPAVYGVIAARIVTGLGQGRDEPGRALLMVHALGLGRIRCIGPVRRGDLLCVSAIPGVAEAQSDDLVRSTTIAKATQDSADDGGERLVPCVLMAG
jgi:hypothetical protein